MKKSEIFNVVIDKACEICEVRRSSLIGGAKHQAVVDARILAVQILIDLDEKKAVDFLECFEGTLKYYNYLTENEAKKVVDMFINQDGSRGPKWRPEEFFQVVQSFGGDTEYEPHYNKWALYVTANKFASDQDSAIKKWTGSDKLKYVEACYDLAMTQPEDKDKLNWARWYFNVND